MNTVHELDNILSQEENQYYAIDSFIDAEEIISKLSEHDIPLLISTWNDRDSSWHKRFSQSSARISQTVLVKLLWNALSSPTEPGLILEIMCRLPKNADQTELSQMLVDFGERLWHSNSELHDQIQMSTWNCGLSNRLLKRLHFKSWKDAGL
jgi:hypothetical protein